MNTCDISHCSSPLSLSSYIHSYDMGEYKSKRESTVIIVGAGPSGLAIAACLGDKSIPYILLEREDCFAPLWKKKTYDRLHLHLPKKLCEFPLMKYPSAFPNYVPRKDFLKFMDDYAAHFNINPVYRRRVVGAKFDAESKRWRVRVTNLEEEEEKEEEYVGRFLVVASGETTDPFCPEIEGMGSFQGSVMHSTDYKSGKEFNGKSVLVVGAGNSGMEIALDLANHHSITSIVVRSPVHILSRWMISLGALIKYLPFKMVDNLVVIMSKLVYGNLSKYGMTRPRDGPFHLKAAFGKYPVIDVGTFQKIKSGQIKVLPGIRSIRGNDVLFEDGKNYTFDAIILATGFKRSTQWLQEDEYLLNEDGLSKQKFPNHWKGINGSYCVGLARRGFYGAALEAQNVANDIKSNLEIP